MRNKMLFNALALLLCIYSVVGCKVVRAQTPPTAGYVTYQSYTPSGACTYPNNLVVVNTNNNNTGGVYQCVGTPLTWQRVGVNNVVRSIDSSTGDFVFTGPGVSHTGNTYTFTGAGAGIGSITWALPSWLSASPTTLNASGTQTFASATGLTANQFLATPNGAPGTLAPRAITANDVPTLNQNTTGTAANLSGTPALPNGTTATTQSPGDNTTKLATTAFVLANTSSGISGLTTGQIPVAGSATTLTSSKPFTGAGAALVTGPISSVSGNVVNYTGVAGAIADSGIASSALVTLTGTQTLTNKTVNGVAPATFAFLDPTSSVQTQLNAKQATVSLTTTGTTGAATFTSNTINIPQYQGALTLTTTGTSGAATLTGNTLNIPNYTTGGSMVYPGAGIAVSTGSAWTTSLTAPAGAIVGTTDTQTLTNKTLDGVSPATMAFVDPTSSIQTQLNAKQGTITLTTTGTSGAATLTGGTLNIPNYSVGGGGNVSSSGTPTNGQLAQWTNASTIQGVAATLASSLFANQGTTTTVLHGNAAGNPSWAAVGLTTDVTGILPGANGGTGNGFFAVTGPTTSGKTFTFPDASATVLTTNAAVTAAQGGTGVANTATLTLGSANQNWATLGSGIVKNTTTTGALSIATAGTDYLTPTGNGSGLTALNASNLGSGTVPVARLPLGTSAAAGAVQCDGTTITCTAGVIAATAGGGTVTHTAGALTSGALVIGNGGADVKVDTGASTDGAGNITATSYRTNGTTPGASSLVAGTGNIPALTANSAGFAAPSTGGTAYLIKFPATITAGIPHFAAPATGDNVNESAMTVSAVSLTADVSGTLPVANGGTGITSLGTGVATWLGTPSSANLISALTDETGSGSAVFATSPTLVTPTLGVATASSINKVAITAPATSATLTIANGKTLTASNSITLAGTDSTTMTFPSASATITQTIASGTATLGTSAITSGSCATAVTVTATGVATTDVVTFAPNADITAVTGYAPVTTGGLSIYPYPTSGNVNFKVCNPTLSSITPGAVTLNWRVVR